jgi:hypothetical protein
LQSLRSDKLRFASRMRSDTGRRWPFANEIDYRSSTGRWLE